MLDRVNKTLPFASITVISTSEKIEPIQKNLIFIFARIHSTSRKLHKTSTLTGTIQKLTAAFLVMCDA